MYWVLTLLGAFLGAAMGGTDAVVLGLFGGLLLGWQGARLSQLGQRIEKLETALRAAQARAVANSAAARSVDSTQASQPAPAAAQREPATASMPPATPAAVTSPTSPAAPPPIPAQAHASVPPEPALASSAAERSASPRVARIEQAAMPRVRQEPDVFERAAAAVKRWLFEGNVPVKIGMLVLFFGVAAALKYALDQGYFSLPIEFRLGAIALGAVAGLIWGWRNREARPAFGLSLQGGAIGVLLLTVFASFGLYKLLSAGTAFALVVVLVAGAAMLALLQNAVWLAVLGFLGGYLAPVLINTGSGNHVALFSWYAILNAAVFAIAWKRPWRTLNLIGFVFTFVVGTYWGVHAYRPELYSTVQPFLLLFFLFYVAIAVLYALRSPDERRPVVDGTLVFGTPLLAFPLQAALLANEPMALAYSALAVATLYAVLAFWLARRRGHQLLGQSFAALAVGFATLAVPLALSARWTSAAWAVEGAALVWLGLRQQRLLPQFAGWALQVLAGIAWAVSVVDDGWHAGAAELALLNGHALGVVLMSLSAFFIAWLHEREAPTRIQRVLVWVAFAIGTGWWAVAGVRELAEHFDAVEDTLGLVAFGALTALLAALLRGWIPWARLGWTIVLVALCGPLLVLLAKLNMDGAITLQANVFWLGWIAAMAWALWRLREPEQRGLSIAHVMGLATLAWLYGTSLYTVALRQTLDDGWVFVAAIIPLALLTLATWRWPRIAAWPLADLFSRYRMRWLIPACIVLAVTWIASLSERGGAAPLPFVPVLNPIELFQLALLLVAMHVARGAGQRADPLRPAIAAAAFLFVSFAALRVVHHYTGAAWSPAILDDRIAQATLTVVWSMLGVTAWIYGSRRLLWNVWLAGAILMGVVLAKLVLVDRQYVGNLAGIVSFMAVGGLLVLVGRIAPTPPRQRAADAEATETSR